MAYNARRAPNVSAYLANLNTIPSAQEVAAGQADFALSDDGLDFLTNTEFFDFDGGFNDVNSFPAAQPQIPEAPAQKGPKAPQYQFGEFQTYPSLTQSPTSGLPSPSNLQGAYPPQPFAAGGSGTKRKGSLMHTPSAADMEESSRFAAEEDKRRRNTAASARFRVKKKQREQALEKASKEMNDKVARLEGKVQRLEMENRWLKELITEKGKVGGGMEGLEERMAVEVVSPPVVEVERSTDDRSDGVGTEEAVKDEA
ncbi:hypothetical protein LTR56_020774 [Elasticomyces elasticus]|nr:hypothetical protein LTR56_020774 [Elasticomyces elasticus]KAK3659308.1 hypothetical protein LTR22_008575 [Elasticomyces elasticus]KAK4925798.1 hypothetical protein LTR49_007174 [Elasticomyces elasticus]KAK5764750.1 hypothetical protein LTS12_005019 [Elasticomyces elasticus]